MSASRPQVLVVDDDAQIRRFLRTVLTAHGFWVEDAATGTQALRATAGVRPDLIILDLGLPDMDGKEVISRVREWSQTPILILSVREREDEKIAALDAGADDYVTKPFSAGELLARMRVAMRHAQAPTGEPVVTVGEVTIDLERHMVTSGGAPVRLSPKEYGILRVLAVSGGRVVTHRQLLRQVWGPEAEEETQYLRVYVRQLRSKLEPDPARPRYITTEPGVGYRLNVLGM